MESHSLKTPDVVELLEEQEETAVAGLDLDNCHLEPVDNLSLANLLDCDKDEQGAVDEDECSCARTMVYIPVRL